MRPHREAVMISVNNTLTPRTGGEYVYKVMKEELLKRGFCVREVSVPLLLKWLTSKSNHKDHIQNLYRVLVHFRCTLESILERCQDRRLVVTSSSPAFPVFGHLVYHQPKTGMCYNLGREYWSLYEKLGFMIQENEKLSPIWYLAKKSHILHLSNSNFTMRLVKKLYGLDSFVLYPPVPMPSFTLNSFQKHRVPGVIVTRPKAVNGITFLLEIAGSLPRRVKFVVIGDADPAGLEVIQILKKKGVKIDYLGYVNERTKSELFNTFSHYLHLGFNESFGVTIVEAMASGCVPIAPRSGAIPEYLPQDLLYSSSNEAAEKIAAKIGFEDSDLAITLRKTAEHFEEQNFRIKFARYVSCTT